MVSLVTKTDINLQSLEQLAIHKTVQVQSYGVLVVLSEPDLIIQQISNNTNYWFGIPAANLIGAPLEELFDSFQLEPLKMGLTQENWDFVNPTKLWARTNGDNYVVFDGVFHRNQDGLLILELEPTDSLENISFLSFF